MAWRKLDDSQQAVSGRAVERVGRRAARQSPMAGLSYALGALAAGWRRLQRGWRTVDTPIRTATRVADARWASPDVPAVADARDEAISGLTRAAVTPY